MAARDNPSLRRDAKAIKPSKIKQHLATPISTEGTCGTFVRLGEIVASVVESLKRGGGRSDRA